MKIEEIITHAITLILLTVLDYFMLSLMQFVELNPKLRYIELLAQGWQYWIPIVIVGILSGIWFKINYPKYYKQ